MELNEIINEVTGFEILLINFIHQTNPDERPTAEKVKDYIVVNKPNLRVNELRRRTFS